MNNTKRILPIVLFLGFLAAMSLGTWLIPKRDFSENEKRYRAEFPALKTDSLLSGEWGEALETWMADHIPFRDFFVGVNAYQDLLLGQQDTKEIRLTDGCLREAPVEADRNAIQRKLDAIGRFAENTDTPVTLALVPSAGWAAGNKGYEDSAILADIAAGLSEKVNYLDLSAIYAGRPELFYRTDHHWTSEGAYLGYRAIADAFGSSTAEESAFQKEVLPDCFRGSTYSRSALWLTAPETIELWHGSDAVTAEASDTGAMESVFDRSKLDTADKYTVFLGGNHPLVRLQNPTGTGKLLVIRDSYSNCLGPFLAESRAEVVLIDLRYYRRPISQLMAEEGFDDVLILYSIGNFVSDTNIVMIR